VAGLSQNQVTNQITRQASLVQQNDTIAGNDGPTIDRIIILTNISSFADALQPVSMLVNDPSSVLMFFVERYPIHIMFPADSHFCVADDYNDALVYSTLLVKKTFLDYRLLLDYSQWTNTFVKFDHMSVNGPKIVPACSISENLIEYHYDLCLMDIPISSPLVFLGTTKSVATSCPGQSSSLNQCHRFHECITAMTDHISHHDCKLGTFNIADLTSNFQPSKADPVLWYHNFEEQYKYFARYVDDLMIFVRCKDTIIKILQDTFFIHTRSTINVFLGGDIF